MAVDVDRPDPSVRLDATTAAVRGLQEIMDAEEPLDDVLTRVAALAARAVPDADAVTITVLTGDEPRTAAWTDEGLVAIDTEQYASDRGPCLEAARTRHAVRAAVGERRGDWPEFTEAAEQAGVRAYLSMPLVVERELVGSLNVYSRTTAAFDPFDERLMRLYSTTAAAAITNARRWQQSRETITQLETALTSRAEIDQAKGVLMAMHGCATDKAFALLVRQSQNTNTKINEVARDLLASIRADHGPTDSSP